MIAGWTVTVTCPHGVGFKMPLRFLYGLDTSWVQSAGQSCAECAKLYAPAERVRRSREDRAVDKAFKDMTKGKRRSVWRWFRDLDA